MVDSRENYKFDEEVKGFSIHIYSFSQDEGADLSAQTSLLVNLYLFDGIPKVCKPSLKPMVNWM